MMGEQIEKEWEKQQKKKKKKKKLPRKEKYNFNINPMSLNDIRMSLYGIRATS